MSSAATSADRRDVPDEVVGLAEQAQRDRGVVGVGDAAVGDEVAGSDDRHRRPAPGGRQVHPVVAVGVAEAGGRTGLRGGQGEHPVDVRQGEAACRAAGRSLRRSPPRPPRRHRAGLQRQTQVGEQVLGRGEEHHVGGAPRGTQGGLPVAAGQLTRVRHDQRRAVEVLPQQRGLGADDVDGDPVLLEHAGDGTGPVRWGFSGSSGGPCAAAPPGDQREDGAHCRRPAAPTARRRPTGAAVPGPGRRVPGRWGGEGRRGTRDGGRAHPAPPAGAVGSAAGRPGPRQRGVQLRRRPRPPAARRAAAVAHGVEQVRGAGQLAGPGRERAPPRRR